MPTHERQSRDRQRVLAAAKERAYARILELVEACFAAEPDVGRVDLGLHVSPEPGLGIHATLYTDGRPTSGGEGAEALKRALRGPHRGHAIMLLDFGRERTFLRGGGREPAAEPRR